MEIEGIVRQRIRGEYQILSCELNNSFDVVRCKIRTFLHSFDDIEFDDVRILSARQNEFVCEFDN